MGKKTTIGFETSATRLQEEFAETLKLLSAEQLDWKEIETSITKSGAESLRIIEENLSDKPKMTESKLNYTMQLILRSNISLTSMYVVKLAEDVHKVHERLVKIEKMIKETKTA